MEQLQKERDCQKILSKLSVKEAKKVKGSIRNTAWKPKHREEWDSAGEAQLKEATEGEESCEHHLKWEADSDNREEESIENVQKIAVIVE